MESDRIGVHGEDVFRRDGRGARALAPQEDPLSGGALLRPAHPDVAVLARGADERVEGTVHRARSRRERQLGRRGEGGAVERDRVVDQRWPGDPLVHDLPHDRDLVAVERVHLDEALLVGEAVGAHGDDPFGPDRLSTAERREG